MSTRAARRSRVLMAGIGVAIAMTVPGCSAGAPAPSAQIMPTAPARPWVKVWSDSFNGPAGQSLSSSTWKFDTGQGTFGTGEIERNTASTSNVRLDGHGDLEIVPVRNGSSWTSARIQTRNTNFGAPAGGEMMVIASIKQPHAAHLTGYWPAFWLLGPGKWPETGEIDILEDVDSAAHYSGTLHCGNLTQKNPDGTTGPCHESAGLGSRLRPCPSCDGSYQSYAVVVDRRNAAGQQIRWYHNGQEYFSVNESRVGTAAWTQGVDHGYHIIFDVAIGGVFPNSDCHCQSPTGQTTPGAAMSVANVAVYYLKPS